jgi:hypothetical protein
MSDPLLKEQFEELEILAHMLAQLNLAEKAKHAYCISKQQEMKDKTERIHKTFPLAEYNNQTGKFELCGHSFSDCFGVLYPHYGVSLYYSMSGIHSLEDLGGFLIEQESIEDAKFWNRFKRWCLTICNHF